MVTHFNLVVHRELRWRDVWRVKLFPILVCSYSFCLYVCLSGLTVSLMIVRCRFVTWNIFKYFPSFVTVVLVLAVSTYILMIGTGTDKLNSFLLTMEQSITSKHMNFSFPPKYCNFLKQYDNSKIFSFIFYEFLNPDFAWGFLKTKAESYLTKISWQ